MRTWMTKSILVLALVVVAVPAIAQTYNHSPWGGNVGVGWSWPQGTAADVVDDDWYLTAGFTYMPAKSSLGFLGEFSYSDYNVKSNLLGPLGYTDSDVALWSLTANGLWSPPSSGKVRFYVTAGFGAYTRYYRVYGGTSYTSGIYCDPWTGFCYSAGYPTTNILTSDTLTKIGFNGGIGLNIQAGAGAVYIDVRYQVMEATQAIEYLPIVIGYRW